MKEPENNGRVHRVNETRHTYRIMVGGNNLLDVYKHSTLLQLIASGYPMCYRRSCNFNIILHTTADLKSLAVQTKVTLCSRVAVRPDTTS